MCNFNKVGWLGVENETLLRLCLFFRFGTNLKIGLCRQENGGF